MPVTFKRITTSGNFIPEIDGLRFIAIVAVVLYHLNGFILAKDTHAYEHSINASFLNNILAHGFLGVPLFFSISGFILGMPFAKFHLTNGLRVNIKHYFFRRLTRLEPPYIIAMTLLLFGAIFVAKSVSINDGIYSYIASIFYVHNIAYPGVLPKLNAVTWSLEVEIQFYIIAPLMALIFTIKSIQTRRILMLTAIIIFTAINKFQIITINPITLINYFQYFIIGFLLADVYVLKAPLLPKTKIDSLIGLICFSAIWVFVDSDFNSATAKFVWEIIQLASIFFLYYYVLMHNIFKFLSLRAITNIGGMCYSIYLLHFPIISMFGNALLGFKFSTFAFVNVAIYSAILLSIVLCLSAIFFLLVERPCMKKDWYKSISLKQKP